MKQLLLDLRNAVWSAREQIKALEAANRDNRIAGHLNIQSATTEDINEVELMKVALEKIEAANSGLVDRINKQQSCMMMYVLSVL